MNSYTAGEQNTPAVASNVSGNFVIVWASYGQDGDQFGIFGQRYDSKGNAVGGEFRVNSYTTGNQHAPEVASAANGDFFAVWDDDHRDAIFAQRFDSMGSAVGGEFQVNSSATAYQYRPSVASTDSGHFVVVWDRGYAYHSDVFGQRFNKQGSPVGGEFQVNSNTTGNQYYPKVESAPDGDFVVVWWSDQAGGQIIGQRYNRMGTALGGEFRVSSTETGTYPAVSSAPKGDFVVVWHSYDGSYDGIFGQRLSRTGP